MSNVLGTLQPSDIRMFKLPGTALLLAVATPLLAQSPDTVARRALRAAPATGEIRIDGRFDEPAWQQAEVASDFTQYNPNPGAAPSQRTEARVLYDAQALYIGMRMYDTHPDSIVAQLARRDVSNIYSDWIQILIDSHFDRRTAFRFGVNPRGVKRDASHFDDTNEDASWDAVWDVATQTDSLGWTAEFRIPLSQLRFRSAPGEQQWGIQFQRDLARRGERTVWSPWLPTHPGRVSRFGTLAGLEGLRSPRRLEILPYATARLTRAPEQSDNPFYRRNAGTPGAGVDLKVGMPKGLTLSATVNPDFGQVEVDPAEVNLSVFESFFPERRPFFTEGSDIFRFGNTRANNNFQFQQYFYSRRIGRAPQGRVDARGGWVDAPEATTILGAAKLSGKTPGGWSIGIMDAVTGREEARFVRTDALDQQSGAVEPLSNYFVGRLRRDLRGGNTVVGGIVTATHRSMGDSVFIPLLHRSAYLGGVDWEHSWQRRVWTLSGYLAGSQVSGSPEAIALTQARPARYFSRPDAGHVELDPTRTSLGGSMGEVSLSRSGNWDGSLQLKQASPGFEINDVGFQGRTDYRSISTFLGRRVDQPQGIFRNHSYFTYPWIAWNWDGDRIASGIGGGANGSFTNFWSAGFNLGYNPEDFSDRLTRGGPLARTPASRNINLFVNSDSRKPVSFSGNLNYSSNQADGWSRYTGMQADIRPSTALRVRVGPSWYRTHTVDQYVRADADSRAEATFGRRYLFAELDQHTVAIDTRIDWTFTPTLSLQLFAQPFVSAGSYGRFKEFSLPRTRDFEVYGEDRGTICRYPGVVAVDPVATRACPEAAPPRGDAAFSTRFSDPDFNFRSLRGNAVLRWEYRPGSALFVVWQQDRSSFVPMGDFRLGRDYGALFREPARNVFMV
ncbi:MAG: carbohydrate binding family 9 domain-containing protein, partial [Gemmatimonadota bacterium]|nr:carbohydrate binding family 9 domain-containing protein [Gemmatimonadota bacterium]